MRTLMTPASFLLAAAFMAAMPAAQAAEQSRNLPAFDSINSQGVFRLVVDAGQKQAVVLKGQDQDLAVVKTEVVGGELILSMPGKHKNWSDDTVHISVSLPLLKRLQIDGAGKTEVKRLNGDRFELVFKGAGVLSAQGTVKHFVLNAQGVGSLDAKDLAAQSADVTMEGVGTASVRASESLNATVNGLGSLSYYGRPPRVNKTVAGIGSVRAGD